MADQVISVKITLNKQKFDSGIKGVKNQLKSADSAAKVLNSTLKKIALGAGAYFSVKGFVGVLRSGVGAANKFAEQLNDTVKVARLLGANVAQLQRIQQVAFFQDVDVRTVNLGLQRMRRRVAEAASGLGEAREALKELGLDAQRLNMMSLDEQFWEIGRALVKAGNDGRQLRLAFKIFDSEGAKIIRTFKAGIGGLNKELDALGVGITAQQQQIIGKFIDMKRTIQIVFSDIGQKFAAQIAPVLTQLGQGFLDFTKRVGGTKEVAKLIGTAFLQGVKVALGALKLLGQGLKTIFNNIHTLGKGLQVALKPLEWTAKVVEFAGSKLVGKEAAHRIGSAAEKELKVLEKKLKEEREITRELERQGKLIGDLVHIRKSVESGLELQIAERTSTKNKAIAKINEKSAMDKLFQDLPKRMPNFDNLISQAEKMWNAPSSKIESSASTFNSTIRSAGSEFFQVVSMAAAEFDQDRPDISTYNRAAQREIDNNTFQREVLAGMDEEERIRAMHRRRYELDTAAHMEKMLERNAQLFREQVAQNRGRSFGIGGTGEQSIKEYSAKQIQDLTNQIKRNNDMIARASTKQEAAGYERMNKVLEDLLKKAQSSTQTEANKQKEFTKEEKQKEFLNLTTSVLNQLPKNLTDALTNGLKGSIELKITSKDGSKVETRTTGNIGSTVSISNETHKSATTNT